MKTIKYHLFPSKSRWVFELYEVDPVTGPSPGILYRRCYDTLEEADTAARQAVLHEMEKRGIDVPAYTTKTWAGGGSAMSEVAYSANVGHLDEA